MTKTVSASRPVTAPATKLISGKGATLRTTAMSNVARLSFAENLSRAASIDNIRTVLGASPAKTLVGAVQTEWMIGRIAARLPVGEFPTGTVSAEEQLGFAREMLLNYAQCAKEGTKASELKAHQTGRRNPLQEKVVRAAREAWSQVIAELGLGAAKTQAEKNNAKRAKRAPHHNRPELGKPVPISDGKAMAQKPSLGAASEVRVTTRESAHEYVEQMAATLLQFANKNAKLLRSDYGKAVQAFKQSINDAANARVLANAKADAIAAEKAK